MERNAIAARSFRRSWDCVTLGVGNHKGCKELLQRIRRAMLLFESRKLHFVQFELLSFLLNGLGGR